MVHVVDGRGEDGSHDLQRGKHRLNIQLLEESRSVKVYKCKCKQNRQLFDKILFYNFIYF